MSSPGRSALWALLLAALLAPAACSVILQTGNFSIEMPSLPADFGPQIPPQGVSGLLVVADPEDGCKPLKPPHPSDLQLEGEAAAAWAAAADLSGGEAPWIALVARTQDREGCTFDVKVANAESAGAVAAIIYDDVYEPLILMAKDPRHPDPFIPAAFVTQKSGIMMKRLMVEGKTLVTLTPLSEALWLSMVVSACAGFLAVNVVLGALWVIRRQQPGPGAPPGPMQQRYGMTAAEIRALPILVYEEPQAPAAEGESRQSRAAAGGSWGEPRGVSPGDASSDSGSEVGRKGGSTQRQCAICLESYGGGDKLRVLPCQHRYHSGCIDQWLSSRRPVCPVCKADAHAPAADADLEAGGSGSLGLRRGRRGFFLGQLGRLGAGWIAVRRQFSPRERRGRSATASPAGGGSPGGDAGETVPEAEQPLLGQPGSRPSTPIPTANTLQHPESAATLINFPSFFPASASGSQRGMSTHAEEITPAGEAASPAAADAAAATAASPAAAAAGAAAVAQASAAAGSWSPGRASFRRVASPPRPCPSPRSPREDPSAGSSPAGGPAATAGPDSTEGSETESEME